MCGEYSFCSLKISCAYTTTLYVCEGDERRVASVLFLCD